MLLALLACTAPAVDDSAAEAVPDLGYLKGTAPLAPVSSGECPTFEADEEKVGLVSHGLDRSVKLLLPPGGAAGKPVVFVWHPLGGTANYMINLLDLRGYAEVADAVVVVVSASGAYEYEWAFAGDGADNDDLVLYDDLRTCLYEQLDIDLGRVSSIGFSAGALWTSFLSLHRGDTLSAILPFSGGTDPIIPYETPAAPFPALLNYGGADDLFGGGLVDFQETTLNFATSLTEDGHFTVVCNHERGHSVPPEGRDMMDLWLTAHVYGEPSPFLQDISGFPDYCSVFATGG
jgi:poly(3-hydroxybutyrate) depolymerase